MVNIVHNSLGVGKLDEILDDSDDVLASKYSDVWINGQIQLAVDTETSHLTEVIALVREEETVDDLTRRGVIGRVSIAQLTVNVCDGFLLRVAGVLLESVENDGEVCRGGVLTLHKDSLHASIENLLNDILCNLAVTVYNNLVTLDRNNFTRVLIYKVLIPRVKYASGELVADIFLECLFSSLYFF